MINKLDDLKEDATPGGGAPVSRPSSVSSDNESDSTDSAGSEPPAQALISSPMQHAAKHAAKLAGLRATRTGLKDARGK